MSSIAVSIIIPVYNVEKYLVKCLDSVLRQTLKNIEIICVDDGATDNCPVILEKYRRQDKRVKVVTQSNGGYGKAMNAGIAAASGEYIGIVEPDDFVLPNMFKTLYNTTKKNCCQIVKSDFFRFIGEDENLKKTRVNIAFEEKNYNRVINPKNEKINFPFIYTAHRQYAA